MNFPSFILVLTLVVYSSVKLVSASSHIVFVLADDMGFNDIGYSEFTDVKTPILDGLAAEGLKLNYSYTPFVCSPSRAAILTGDYPFRYGLQQNAIDDGAPVGLDLDYDLLPARLKKLGYQTHMVGKWHLGYCNNDFTPLKRGFDTFQGFLGGAIDYYDHQNQDLNILDYRKNGDIRRNREYSTYDFANAAKNIILENTDTKPMFLYLPLNAIHGPLNPPPGMKDGHTASKRAIVREMVKTVDEFVGTVVDALKSKDMWEDTIFIFSSDNGGQPKIGGNNYPLKGTKHTIWEGGTRVRTFITGKDVPKNAERNEVFNGLFYAVDWLPTILSMAGADTDNLDLDGVNQWQALKKNSKKLSDHPRKSFIYNLDRYQLQDGSIEDRSGVRHRFEVDDNKFEDFKLVLGNGGVPFHTFKSSDNILDYTIEQMQIHNFKDGAVFDMNTDAGLLERKWLENPPEKYVKIMKDLLLDEKKKGLHLAFDMQKLEPKAKNMKGQDGNFIAAPGWC